MLTSRDVVYEENHRVVLSAIKRDRLVPCIYGLENGPGPLT